MTSTSQNKNISSQTIEGEGCTHTLERITDMKQVNNDKIGDIQVHRLLTHSLITGYTL